MSPKQFQRTVHGAVLLMVMALALLTSATPALRAQGLTPEQVVTIERVSSVALSPDGSQIAYTLIKPRGADEEYGPARSELWMVSTAGGASRAIVEAPLSASSPQWSPSGRWLGFVARLTDRDPAPQVYAVPAAGGEPRMLTRSPTGVLTYAWAPDGSAVAYTAKEPADPNMVERQKRGDDAKVAGEGERHVRLWVERLEGGQPVAVTPVRRTVRSFAWSRDARTFAVQMTEGADIDQGYMYRRLMTVAAGGGRLERLAETRGKLGPMAWSPDGSKLAFLGATSLNDPLPQSVFVVPSDGGPARNLTPNYEGSAISIGWLDDRTVLFLANEGTKRALNRVDTERGAVERIIGGGPQIFGRVSLDDGKRTFAVAASTAQHPGEVFTGTIKRGELRRVTTHNPWLDGVSLGLQETIEWTGADGWRIAGVLVHPLNEQPGVRYPLAILPHGGPEGISLDGWTTSALYPAQMLAGRGYAVLMPNYRGSGGRGVAFSKGDHRDLGGKEFLDVIAGIDHLAAQGLVDLDRVGISGTSYGGYFSAWAAMKHTDRFKAAITFAGISNWVSFTGTTDIPYEMSLVHWDTWWFDDPGLAWDRSPLAHINGARTATLVAHGLADTRVHPEQSVELYTGLRIKGVPSGLVLYPREPHGLRERAHQLDFMRRVLEWFQQYVKEGRPATD